MSKLWKPTVLLTLTILLFHNSLKNILAAKIDYLDSAIYLIGLPLCILWIRKTHYKNQINFNQVFINSFVISILVQLLTILIEFVIGNTNLEAMNDPKVQDLLHKAEQNNSYSGNQESEIIKYVFSTQQGLFISSFIASILSSTFYSLILALLLRKEK